MFLFIPMTRKAPKRLSKKMVYEVQSGTDNLEGIHQSFCSLIIHF